MNIKWYLVFFSFRSSLCVARVTQTLFPAFCCEITINIRHFYEQAVVRFACGVCAGAWILLFFAQVCEGCLPVFVYACLCVCLFVCVPV